MTCLKRLLLALISAFLILGSSVPVKAEEKSKEDIIPRTFLILDVSGSTRASRGILTSLYKIILELFQQCPYKMELTTLMFDKHLLTDPDCIIEETLGQGTNSNIQKKLNATLNSEKVFCCDTAVHRSLSEFEDQYLDSLSDEDCKNANVIVFSDMVSTVDDTSDVNQDVNKLFYEWQERGITVKSLVWTENGDSDFVFEHVDDSGNTMCQVNLNNMLGAYESLLYIYFGLLTGEPPAIESYDTELHKNQLIVFPSDAYEIYLLAVGPDKKIVYYDSETAEESDGSVLLEDRVETIKDEINGFPLSVYKIGREEASTIQNVLAEDVSELKMYYIQCPEIVSSKIDSDSNNHKIYSKEPVTFTVTVNLSQLFWEEKAEEMYINTILQAEQGERIERPIGGEYDKRNQTFIAKDKDGFPEGKKTWNVSVQLKDGDNHVLDEQSTKVYVGQKSSEDPSSAPPHPDPDHISIPVYVIAIIAILVVVFIMVVLCIINKNRKEKHKWNI